MQLALVSSAVFATSSIAPVEVLLRKEGSRSVLAKYFDCGSQGQPYYEGVAHGEVRWLKVATALTAEAQGCQLQLLQDALARALVAKPADVLALVDSSPKLAAKHICVPFLSADEPRELHVNQLERSEHALNRVHTPKLRTARSACLAEIARSRSRFE